MSPRNTMALIDRLVATFPPFPLAWPLQDQITGEFNKTPCGNPIARVHPSERCRCGFFMGEHPRPTVAMKEAAE